MPSVKGKEGQEEGRKGGREEGRKGGRKGGPMGERKGGREWTLAQGSSMLKCGSPVQNGMHVSAGCHFNVHTLFWLTLHV